MVSKKVFYQMHRRFIEIFNLLNLLTKLGFSDSQIVAARNGIFQTGGLSKTLTLKLESKHTLTTDNRLPNQCINWSC